METNLFLNYYILDKIFYFFTINHTKYIFETFMQLMKINILFFVLFIPFTLFSQTKEFTIQWEESSKPALSKNGYNKVLLKEKAIEKLNLQLTEDKLKYSKVWKDEGFALENSLEITQVNFKTMTSEELKTINKKLVPHKINATIKSNKARNTIQTVLTITPIINEKGIYKKIISFSANYKIGAEPLSRNTRSVITNSVLASGNWYRFKVEKTGIHKITKNFLESLGMNIATIDPRTLKIYSFGGKPLPLLNSLNTNYDLPEVTIQVIGEEDGSFDIGDYILFYGESVFGFDEENDTNNNPYSDESYYYITADGQNGLRVQPMVEPSGNVNHTITQFNDYQFHEEDDFNPVIVGRRWIGNNFDIENTQNFEFSFPNIVSGQPMHIKVNAAAASETNTSMAITINGTSVNPLNFSIIGGSTLLITRNYEGDIPAAGETVTIELAYNNAGNVSSKAYLDYISIDALRQLKGVDDQFNFRYNEAENLVGVGEYQISNASQFSQVWDVTNPSFITSKNNENNQDIFTFKTNLGEIKEYVAIHTTNFLTPIKESDPRVYNQNLKGTIFNDESGNFQDIDYLIITSPKLIQPALRLANHRRTLDGLNVKVVTTDKIYHEFSSGKQDISAIRNFVKYVYDNASSSDKKVKYLCLFGDTSVDYKNRFDNNNNIVPTFHTLSSTSTHNSYMSDDFFGMMDNGEGQMLSNDFYDIAIGRILADNVSLANDLVNKIIDYDSKISYGNWRNNFVLISDDVDKASEFTLEENLDNLGDEISSLKPSINVKKIHSDSYLQETSAGGNRYPKVNEAIKNGFNVGAIIMNYFGHGGEDGLAHEYIYTKEIAQNLKNTNRYPCFVTVTCEFTKFDNPKRPTAGEYTYWNREGGAISLVTTTRSISIGLGISFNQILAPNLFGYNQNVPKTPAEALRDSKNSISTSERRVIFYIGDPAMHLAFPKPKVELKTLNEVPIDIATDTLKALSKVKLGGQIVDESGNLLSNYNGVLEAKIFDKNVLRHTLDNDHHGLILDFITLGEGIFNGQATVSNGIFEFEFVVPRDIQIPVDTGRASFYAQNNTTLENQTGYNLDLKIGGLNEDAPEDNQGPLIQLFMNDESFVSGGITSKSPILIAKLEDENGINTASGIGHDITAIIDGDETNPLVLNEYYQATIDDYTKGIANFKLNDLEVGLHTLTLKAWDVYNNSSSQDIQFIVTGDNELKITNVLNYPNPFVNYTEFWFNHNRDFDTLEVQVQVFTVTGKVVWTQNEIFPPSGSNLFRAITWDGRDDFGDRIGKGVYIYKITVKSTLTNKQVEKFEKLVIL